MSSTQDPDRNGRHSEEPSVEREAPNSTPTNPSPKSGKSSQAGLTDAGPDSVSGASSEQADVTLTPDHASAARGEEADPAVRTVLDSDETGHN